MQCFGVEEQVIEQFLQMRQTDGLDHCEVQTIINSSLKLVQSTFTASFLNELLEKGVYCIYNKTTGNYTLFWQKCLKKMLVRNCV